MKKFKSWKTMVTLRNNMYILYKIMILCIFLFVIRDITKHIEFLVNFRRNIEQNQLMEIDFGELFLKNYLKIISNIYFINLKKVQESFKLNYVHRKFFFKNYCHLNDVLIKLYSDFLKETRYLSFWYKKWSLWVFRYQER